jgi:hypothetical protein
MENRPDRGHDHTVMRPTEPDPKDFMPDPMPEAMLIELGRLITRWGYLESVVENLLAGFLGTEPQLLFPITADIQISTRLRHLRMVAKLRLSPEHFAILSHLVSQAEELCRFRNYVIHGLWNLLEASDDIVMIMQTRPSKKSAVTRQIAQYCNVYYLKWLIAAVSGCMYLLHDFGKQFGLIESDEN